MSKSLPYHALILTFALCLPMLPAPADASGCCPHSRGSSKKDSHEHVAQAKMKHDAGAAAHEDHAGELFVCSMDVCAYHAAKAGECPYCGMRLTEKPLSPATLAEVGRNLVTKFGKLTTQEKWGDLKEEFVRVEDIHQQFHGLDFTDKDAAKPLISEVHAQTAALKKAIDAKDSAGVNTSLAALRKVYEAMGKLKTSKAEDSGKPDGGGDHSGH
jgi:hypothetical protein